MKLRGPDCFELQFDARKCRVLHPNGARTFSGKAAAIWPKLYIFAADQSAVYVGITRRPMSARLRAGWAATGRGGYHGYAMRHHRTSATLLVWYGDEDNGAQSTRYMETVEAEVAYLIRNDGQWPLFQTEIHFYQSNAEHRRHAKRIVEAVSRALRRH